MLTFFVGAIGLQILVNWAGELSLAHAQVIGICVFTVARLSSAHGISPLLLLPGGEQGEHQDHRVTGPWAGVVERPDPVGPCGHRPSWNEEVALKGKILNRQGNHESHQRNLETLYS